MKTKLSLGENERIQSIKKTTLPKRARLSIQKKDLQFKIIIPSG